MYRDYREMLEKQKDIEAVIIATPDHISRRDCHGGIGAGKHVYVQKPLTYSVLEARVVAKPPGRRRFPRKWAIRDTPAKAPG